MLVNVTVLLGGLLETQSQMREVYVNKYIVRLSGYKLHNGTEWAAERRNLLLKSTFKIKCIFPIRVGKTKTNGDQGKEE